jgi:hypothetical protein
MKLEFTQVVAAIALGTLSVAAFAAPITLTGNFVQVGVNDIGTLGSGGTTPPGMRHDPTGTGNFTPGGIANDYLTPGTPSEAFAVSYGTSTARVFQQATNAGPSTDFTTVTPTALTTEAGYSLAGTWSGTIAGVLNISHTYFFNAGDERVNIRTTITALEDLVGLNFGRHLDPDPDVNRFGDFATTNTRGNSVFAAEDLVSAAGRTTGLTVGLLDNQSTYFSNTGISDFCCSIDNPDNVLVGYGPTSPTTNVGDFGLQMAWAIGNLARGATATITYAYVFGERQDTVGGGTVPVPMSALLVGLGLVGVALSRRQAK